MTLGERLHKAMIDKGSNPNKLSVKTGIHASTINNWIQNNTKPDHLKLDKVCEVLKVNIVWIVTGEGTAYRKTAEVINKSEDPEEEYSKLKCNECAKKEKQIKELTKKYIEKCDELNELNIKFREYMESKIEIKKETTPSSDQKAG